MNRAVLSFALAVCVCVTAVPSLVFAQNRPYALTFSPSLGGLMFEGNQGLKDSTMPSLAVGYNFSERFAAEGILGYIETETSQTPGVDVRGYSARLDLLYHFQPQKQLVPFVALGFGAVSYEPKGGSSDEDLLAGYGLGAKYYLAENLALRADVRHLFHFNVNDTNNSRDYHHNLLYSVGLHFQLGGVRSTAAVAAPVDLPASAPLRPVAAPQELPPPVVETVTAAAVVLDSDGDGVPDHLDRCPNTPWGEVDQHGCPRDDDGDGVPNYLDRCPDTPRGQSVDAWGCSEAVRLDITFLPKDATLDPRHHGELAAIAETIRRAPKGTIVRIEGHTDSVGTSQDNLLLSKKRAEAVRGYLLKLGIAPTLLVAEGLGDSRPVAENSSQKGRAQNRRVTIQMLKVE